MTLAELAIEFDVSTDDLYDFFYKEGMPVAMDVELEVSKEKIELAKEVFIDKLRLPTNQSPEPEASDSNIELSEAERLKKFNEILAKPDRQLLQDLCEANDTDRFILSGRFEASNSDYGFFRDILLPDGSSPYYPNPFQSDPRTAIGDVFIYGTAGLVGHERYFFEPNFAKIRKRKERENAYLIEATLSKVMKAKDLKWIQDEIEAKKIELLSLEEPHAERLRELEEKSNRLDRLIEESKNDMNENIELHNKLMAEQDRNRLLQQEEIDKTDLFIEERNSELEKMESLIHVLQERLALCKNLEFINEHDELQFLNVLTAEEYSPENHLSFSNDLDSDFKRLSEHIHGYLFHQKKLIYSEWQIKDFLTLLRCNDLVILSGLSGSGKTQIVKAFAEALGGVAKIIPVKPNWTSSEDLLGYYNPLQMSFLPTPFTEAIVEAMMNPQRLYLICLDEMNLARVEYYFADFLSKLEERENQPEIELYAQHEEELFVSEFNTLLNLIERSIGDSTISGWQDFLDDESVRKRFFSMLGDSDHESMLQLHSKMRRRLVDLLKFPSTMKIPSNVRFVGAINVDETTHYFSPKILDRVHIMKFDNPLLIEERVNDWFEEHPSTSPLQAVHMKPEDFSKREVYPALNGPDCIDSVESLKKLNKEYLLPLNIDFGVRSIRQSANFILHYAECTNKEAGKAIGLNTVILQKLLPRFVLDAGETGRNGKKKIETIQELKDFLVEQEDENNLEDYDSMEFGIRASKALGQMLDQAEYAVNSQMNFFA